MSDELLKLIFIEKLIDEMEKCEDCILNLEEDTDISVDNISTLIPSVTTCVHHNRLFEKMIEKGIITKDVIVNEPKKSSI